MSAETVQHYCLKLRDKDGTHLPYRLRGVADLLRMMQAGIRMGLTPEVTLCRRTIERRAARQLKWANR